MHPQVRWFFRCQVVVTLLAALLAGLALGVDAAVSAALGGGIAMASALAYAWRGLRATADAKNAFHAQVAAEGYKFAVTLLLFAVVFKSYAQLAALPLFLAYAATIFVYWMTLLRQH